VDPALAGLGTDEEATAITLPMPLVLGAAVFHRRRQRGFLRRSGGRGFLALAVVGPGLRDGLGLGGLDARREQQRDEKDRVTLHWLLPCMVGPCLPGDRGRADGGGHGESWR